MTSLYDIFPGIQVTADDILQAEMLAAQVLQAKYPDLDLRPGTGLRDLAIRPSATLLAMLNKAVTFFFTQRTLADITNDTPQEFLDKIMSNWFLQRKVGSRAIINSRLFFAKQKEILLGQDTFFSPDNNLKYFPTALLSLATGNLIFSAFDNEWYYDVDLVADQEGEDYNISSGSLLYFSNFDSYFLRAEINFLREASIATENNSEFIQRAQTAISTRNLINVPSITSKMLEDFTLLEGVSPIGFGDPEMVRDQIWTYVPTLSPPTALVHNGGCVDIYSRVPVSTGIIQVATDVTGKAPIFGAIYKTKRSQIPGTAINDTLPFYITKSVTSINRSSTTATVITSTNHGFSSGNTIVIAGATPSGYNGSFTITVTNVTTFTYTCNVALTTPATGTITANKEVPYTLTNGYGDTKTLTSLTSSGTTATATLNSHGLAAARYVTIAGAAQTAYNGVYLITSVPTQNTFTYTFAGSGTSPATGTISVNYTIPQQDFGFSSKQKLVADFGVSYASLTASFEVNFFEDIDGLQEYLEDASRRVLCADILARGYNIYLLDITITAYNGPAPDSLICQDILTKYLKSLDPGQLFVMGDLIAKLNDGGIETIKTPLDVNYTFYHRDLIPAKTGTITDYFDSNDRTAIFLLSSVTTLSQNIT